jgi:hypothetical protein
VFFENLLNKKILIWYLLFICTFAPILTFYLPTKPYHYESFSFLLTSFAVTYFIWADKIRAAFLQNFIDNTKKSKNVFSMKSICIVVIISSLVLNSFKVVYHNLNLTKALAYGNIVKTEKEYRKAMSILLEKVADYLINNSKSNRLVVSKKKINFSDNNNFSDNSRFLFVYIRHKDKDFNIIYDPNVQLQDYSSDFISKLELLDLDPKIGFDPQTEKYIMGKVGENLITNNGFEYERDMSFKYSNLSHSGDFSMVLRKEDYQEIRNGYRPDLGLLTLEPGFYLFGGYYKSDNLSDSALFEIVDSRGYKIGSWHSNTISGSTEWKLLKGKLYLKEKSEVLLRPLCIDNFHSGKVYVDDLFLIKL